MCLNSRSVFACPKKESKQEVLSCSQIYLMNRSLCKFLMSKKGLLEGKWLSFLGFCGTVKVKEMPLGKGKTIYMYLTPHSMKNGTSFKSRDKIFVRGEGCNTPSVSLHDNHEHCINISIIMLIHKHHIMITCHLMYTMCDWLAMWLAIYDSIVWPMHISAPCLPNYFNHVYNNILSKVYVGGFAQKCP